MNIDRTVTGMVVQAVGPSHVHYRLLPWLQLKKAIPMLTLVRGCIWVAPWFLSEKDGYSSWKYDWGWTDGEDDNPDAFYPRLGKWGAVPTKCDLSDRKSYVAPQLFDFIGLELAFMDNPWNDSDLDNNLFFDSDKVFSFEEDWREFLCAGYGLMNQPLQVDEKMYFEWLGAMPPIVMNDELELPDGRLQSVHFVVSEGRPMAGFEEDGKYFMMRVSGGCKVRSSGRTLDDIYYNAEIWKLQGN